MSVIVLSRYWYFFILIELGLSLLQLLLRNLVLVHLLMFLSEALQKEFVLGAYELLRGVGRGVA